MLQETGDVNKLMIGFSLISERLEKHTCDFIVSIMLSPPPFLSLKTHVGKVGAFMDASSFHADRIAFDSLRESAGDLCSRLYAWLNRKHERCS